MQKYQSTQDQMNKQFGKMYETMRDPEAHQRKSLENKQKQNVQKTAERYGLG